ncbi:nucleoside-specific channel-forming protein Tsx [Kushneria phyllosphaerae]|uniref:Nucleoside-specific channel-forming protein tsx n=1 Tax=Kushneria phyllosphaerae TaxID=2100822 RepID=A0A2R8CKA4_9GAMM|nr:nucleoside-specific channel-forming protein Tsx [Kushneria phyllosphaerae]SPJ33305.1 Nucleoside-specific channel-forming protein tsx [Kushneria phyllosphaerae]
MSHSLSMPASCRASLRTSFAMSGALVATALLLPLTAHADQQSSETPAASGETASYDTTDESPRSAYLSDWYNQNVTVIGSKDIRFGPQKIDDIYLEYEFFGRKGPLDLYGYIDMPKFFGIGNAADSGAFDGGSPIFAEIKPRLSLNELSGRDLSLGPISEWYLAANWIYDWGHNSDNRQNTLYTGLGTDIDTGSPLGMSFNFYGKYQWENYGAENENSWDGYRAQLEYNYPLASFDNGASLFYAGFTNYDFGSDLGDGDSTRTNEAVVATNAFVYSFTHLRFLAVARYFHNGGQWNDGSELNFGDGDFRVRSTGWGYYLGVGWQF